MSDILVVGIPKSGTNATEKACKMLGLSPSHHMHTANYHLAEANKVAYVYRNPRNVLISALRYRNHQRRGWVDVITEDLLIDCFYDFFSASLPAVYNSYAKWHGSTACCFKFEDLINDVSTINRIADYMGVAHLSSVDGLVGGTPTWTGKLSSWEDCWGDRIDSVWNEEGMSEIEKRLGYECQR